MTMSTLKLFNTCLMFVGLIVITSGEHFRLPRALNEDGSHCIDDSESPPCIRGCKQSFYGLSCNTSCPENCYGACSQGTGACLTGCETSWHKSNCTKECKGRCKHKICDIQTAECISGCDDGFYGLLCDKKCSSNCLGSCDEFGGCKCKEGAKDPACDIECSDSCVDRRCEFDDDAHLYCVNGCVPGRTGKYCQEFCPDNCLQCYTNATCIVSSSRLAKRSVSDRCSAERNGACVCCSSGWTGHSCSTECPKCISGYINYTCHYLCDGGFFGEKCKDRCSANCSLGSKQIQTCAKKTGKCHGCLLGHHGDYCEKSCNSNCANNICYHHNATCLECTQGTYGAYCEDVCGQCEGKCDRNGTCSKCRPGFFGLRCKKRCSLQCESNDCRVDIRGNHLCYGNCVKGYSGDDCQSKCPSGCHDGCQKQNGTCDKNPGGGTEMSPNRGVVASVALIIAIGVVIYLCRRDGRGFISERINLRSAVCCQGKKDNDPGEGTEMSPNQDPGEGTEMSPNQDDQDNANTSPLENTENFEPLSQESEDNQFRGEVHEGLLRSIC